MVKSVSDIGEFPLINKIRSRQRSAAHVIKGIGDDAAVLKLDAARYLLFTTDMLVEGVHFSAKADPKSVGHKALACNISDIAAMGGIPASAVVSIGLPPATLARYVKGLYDGISGLAKQFNVSIVGGDTVRADQLVINIALLGEVEKRNLVLRSGARPGDIVFVSGPLGNTLKSGKHLQFTPRVKQARFLVDNFKPSAMIDISDGLIGDLGHILKESAVGAVIEAVKIPRNPGASLDEALSGGEDFELLFTLPLAKARKLIEYAQSGVFRFTDIGIITAGANKLQLKDAQGRLISLTARAYRHF